MSSNCVSDRSSEPKPYSELRRARLAVAAAERRQHEEVRRALVDDGPAVGDRAGVAEVRDVEEVVQLEARVERLLREPEAVAQFEIGLLEARSARAVACKNPVL